MKTSQLVFRCFIALLMLPLSICVTIAIYVLAIGIIVTVGCFLGLIGQQISYLAGGMTKEDWKAESLRHIEGMFLPFIIGFATPYEFIKTGKFSLID